MRRRNRAKQQPEVTNHDLLQAINEIAETTRFILEHGATKDDVWGVLNRVITLEEKTETMATKDDIRKVQNTLDAFVLQNKNAHEEHTALVASF
ncbi:MAG: hypothetical protein HYV32_04510 [Candidatus Kerfeldbacteria bacterium]|nr:hypothetical protein [Candidatus Kerfeldbacteria bacterium]